MHTFNTTLVVINKSFTIHEFIIHVRESFIALLGTYRPIASDNMKDFLALTGRAANEPIELDINVCLICSSSEADSISKAQVYL